MPKRKWYEIKARANNTTAEILLYEEIGSWGVSAKQFRGDLEDLGNVSDIEVRINSPGGSVFDGAAIFNLLKQHDAKVTVFIDGLAASIASVIAMAGDEIIMAENALMMIHDPWSLAIGNAADFRREADFLDKVKDTLVTTYETRTGMDRDEIAALLTDETWLDAEEAVEFGFADRTVEARLEAARIRRHVDPEKFDKLPAALAHDTRPAEEGNRQPKDKGEKVMSETKTEAVDLEKIKRDGAAEALAADKKRRSEISNVFAKFPDQGDLMRTCQDDVDCDVASARAKLLEKLGEGEEPTAKVDVSHDGSDRFRDGAAKALFAKAGLEKRDAQNEYNSYNLFDLARATLERNGVSTGRMTKMDLVAAAFTHSTGDFGNILSNVASKSMLKGWDDAEEVYDRFTARGTLPDFKAATRVDLGAFPSLREVRPGAEFKHVSLTDRAETIQLATYGELFSINRQAIINDDMGLFSTVPGRFGRAARRTVGDLVFAVITGNQVMSDGTALFHADHDNLATGAAPTTAVIDGMRQKMALQKDPDNNVTALNIRPSFMLAPVALAGQLMQVIESETEIAASQNNSRRPNYVRNIADVISDARLDAASATAYYMLTNPSMHDTIEVAYLDGIEQPFLDQMMGWTIDGSEFKVRIDAGVKALDFRGMVKNPGA